MEKINYSEVNITQGETNLLGGTNNEKINEEQEIIVRAPRKIIWELVLMVFTFSFYIPFWAVSRARDMKSATSNNYTPWLWFFTPLLWVPGVIAYKSMFKDLQNIEGKEQRNSWEIWGKFWFFAFILLSLFFNTVDAFQTRLSLQILGIVFFCVLFSTLHRRFNQWKANDERLTFKGKRVGYTWYEWLVLAFSVPCFLFIVYGFVWKDLMNFNLPKYENLQEVVVENSGFHFTVHGDNWKKIEPDDAVFAMVGSGDETSVFVYRYDNGLSINDQASLRFSILEETYKDIKCTETQSFENGRSGVKSIMKCSATYWGDDVGLTSVVSSLDGSLLEFVGVTTSTNSLLNEKISRQIYVMAESFHLIVGQENE